MKIYIIVLLLFLGHFSWAQAPIEFTYKNNLSKLVTITVKQQKVSNVLNRISAAGKFYFAYNGALFGQDSLVSLNVKNVPVRDVLDQVFGGKVDYKENADYIILRYAVHHLTIEPESIVTAENLYMISGHIIDLSTKLPIKNASVYEKKLLQSTLTDEKGFFTLKFKGEHASIILTAGKETYRDTSLVFLSSINIKPTSYDDPDKEKGTFFSNAIEDLGLGRFFLSSKQRIQSINIPNFLASTPFQASLTPGLSSHGMMSGSVVNKVSLNVLGGYTAGVDGAEVAGLFNLTKGDVKKVQVAGLFNLVGGNVDAVQIAGLMNDTRGKTQNRRFHKMGHFSETDTVPSKGNVKKVQMAGLLNMAGGNVAGVQVAGLLNTVHGKMYGVQISGANHVKGATNGVQVSGIGNLTSGEFKGLQITGLVNINSRNTAGFQLAGIGNITSRTLNGFQLGLINVAKNNKGFQLGLINYADTSTGVSLGLINVIKNGYYKIGFSSNDLINANVTLKTGNAKLYTIFLAGKNFSDTAKIETFGLGLGHDVLLNKHFSIGLEGTVQRLHLGYWDNANLLTKATLNLQIRLFKGLSVFGGPTYNYYLSDAPSNTSAKNYKQQIVPRQHQTIGDYKGWLGWNLGISLF